MIVNNKMVEIAHFLLSLNTFANEDCKNCYKRKHNQCEDICFAYKVAKDMYNAGFRKIEKKQKENENDTQNNN